MTNNKGKTILLICLILSLALMFGGCTITEDSAESRALCDAMVAHIIQNDYTAAYGMVQSVASEEEFQPLWNQMRTVLKDSSSYELQQKNWYKNWNNGVTTTQVLFEISTDDGKICQMLIYTRDGIEGIAGLNFLDSTDFVNQTEVFGTVNIFLIIFSVLCFAFSIWMFIDCLKRRPNHKILWAILTLCYVGGSLTTGASEFSVNFRVSLICALTNISADRTALAVTATAFLPLGAIIYFFVRKRLTPPKQENENLIEPQ